jgi:hypothetical protein
MGAKGLILSSPQGYYQREAMGKITKNLNYWGMYWQGNIIFLGGKPQIFRTRQEAREYISNNYGYIKFREDLKRPPFNWKMPVPIKINLTITATV